MTKKRINIGYIGKVCLQPFYISFSIIMIIVIAFRSSVTEFFNNKKFPGLILVKQIYFTGVNAIPFISFTAILFGVAVIAELYYLLPSFGVGEYVERLAAIVIVRELTPILVAFIVISRSGNAISTELANMVLNRELDLLKQNGINTNYFVIMPRIIGVAISTIALTIYFGFFSLIGGAVICKLTGILPSSALINKFLLEVMPIDLISGIIKAFIFGIVISVSSAMAGLSVLRSFTEVPKAATKGVVVSIIACLFVNIIITMYVLILG